MTELTAAASGLAASDMIKQYLRGEHPYLKTEVAEEVSAKCRHLIEAVITKQ